MKLEQQIYFRMKDLENLSATTLYTGDLPPMGPGGFSGFGGGFGGPKRDSYGIKTPMFKTPMMEDSNIEIEPIKIGTFLPGDLTIKKANKNTITLQQDFGGVGNIYTAHPDGGGATRFYGLGTGEKKVTKSIWDKYPWGLRNEEDDK